MIIQGSLPCLYTIHNEYSVLSKANYKQVGETMIYITGDTHVEDVLAKRAYDAKEEIGRAHV